MKPMNLKKGDKVAIVSLSNGLLGNPKCAHELVIGEKRLRDMGLEPVYMDNSREDFSYLSQHPEARAADLKQAFLDPTIKGIITAIGGNDTYKTIPYLMEDEEFVSAVKNNPKIFIGFSDTTNNHLMLNKLGLSTFYGPCFLIDIAELDDEMIPYTRECFEKLFMNEERFEIESSPIWYGNRESYAKDQVGVPRDVYEEKHGYEVLNGSGIVSGLLYGGCLESLYDAMVTDGDSLAPSVYKKYDLLPSDDEWSEKILFIEPSEECAKPEDVEKMLLEFKRRGILSLVKGVMVGKPMDEIYYDEYKDVFRKVFSDLETPVIYNVNFGHALPRCILPYDGLCSIDLDNKKIYIESQMLEYRDSFTKKI